MPDNPSQQSPAADKPNPADFLAAMARGEHTDEQQPDQADQPAPGSPADTDAASSEADFSCEDEVQLEPIQPQISTLASATAAARPRKRKHQPMSPGWRYAVPPMAVMAGLMLLLGFWGIARMAGVVTSGKLSIARLMLLAFPVALILGAGCVFVWKDTHRGAR